MLKTFLQCCLPADEMSPNIATAKDSYSVSSPASGIYLSIYLSIAEHRVFDQDISHYFSLFWIAAIIININLHKASIFIHSHIDKSINNLKNISSRYIKKWKKKCVNHGNHEINPD